MMLIKIDNYLETHDKCAITHLRAKAIIHMRSAIPNADSALTYYLDTLLRIPNQWANIFKEVKL